MQPQDPVPTTKWAGPERGSGGAEKRLRREGTVRHGEDSDVGASRYDGTRRPPGRRPADRVRVITGERDFREHRGELSERGALSPPDAGGRSRTLDAGWGCAVGVCCHGRRSNAQALQDGWRSAAGRRTAAPRCGLTVRRNGDVPTTIVAPWLGPVSSFRPPRGPFWWDHAARGSA